MYLESELNNVWERIAIITSFQNINPMYAYIYMIENTIQVSFNL